MQLSFPGQEYAEKKKMTLRDRLLGELEAAVPWAGLEAEWREPGDPFHRLKTLFGPRKVRYRGLAKNEAQLFSLFALANPPQPERRGNGAAAQAHRDRANSGLRLWNDTENQGNS